MMSRFLGDTKAKKLAKMMRFLMVFVIFVALETRAFTNGKMDLSDELYESTREEWVEWAGYGEEKLSTVVIGGKLLCHDAGIDETALLPPSPISGASVGVFCGTNRKAKKSWARGSTNTHGEFLIDLPSHLHAIPNLEKVCMVKVVQLPKSSPCRQTFTGKHKCMKLTSIGEGTRIYTTNDIHLMPKPSSQEHMKKGGKKHHKASAL